MAKPPFDISLLHQAVAAACPIDGVYAGDWNVRATWNFWPQAVATPAQITAGQAAMAAFDPVATEAAKKARVSSLTSDSNYQTLVNELGTYSASQIDTWLTNNVTTLAQARIVLGAIIKYLASQGSA
jgi:hypothetical protein